MATNYPFNTLIPAAGNNPSNDQPLMQTNNASTNSIIGTDHLTFGTASGNQTDGMHTIIHLPTQSVPSAIAGIGQLFTQNVTVNSTTDTQLFFLTGGNNLQQLSGNFAPAFPNTGYAIFSNMIFQWGSNFAVSSGSFVSGSATGTITFNRPFPGNILSVNFTLYYNSTLPNNPESTISWDQSTLTGGPYTSLKWQFFSTSTKFTGFSWMVIGN